MVARPRSRKEVGQTMCTVHSSLGKSEGMLPQEILYLLSFSTHTPEQHDFHTPGPPAFLVKAGTTFLLLGVTQL